MSIDLLNYQDEKIRLFKSKIRKYWINNCGLRTILYYSYLLEKNGFADNEIPIYLKEFTSMAGATYNSAMDKLDARGIIGQYSGKLRNGADEIVEELIIETMGAKDPRNPPVNGLQIALSGDNPLKLEKIQPFPRRIEKEWIKPTINLFSNWYQNAIDTGLTGIRFDSTIKIGAIEKENYNKYVIFDPAEYNLKNSNKLPLIVIGLYTEKIRSLTKTESHIDIVNDIKKQNDYNYRGEYFVYGSYAYSENVMKKLIGRSIAIPVIGPINISILNHLIFTKRPEEEAANDFIRFLAWISQESSTFNAIAFYNNIKDSEEIK